MDKYEVDMSETMLVVVVCFFFFSQWQTSGMYFADSS